MKEKRIVEAYNTIRPDSESKKRVMQKICEKENRVGQEEKKKQIWISRPAAVLLLCSLVLAGGITSLAMWNYLTPSQVAEEFEDNPISKVFSSGDVISINEKQCFKNYNVTLFGMLLGSDIEDCLQELNGEIEKDKTYCVLAIENADGSDMTNVKEKFLATPFIQGESPSKVNIFVMNGGALGCIKKGVLYKIIDCDDLSMFANRKVYMAVTEGSLPSDLHIAEGEGEKAAYIYDKKSGEVTRNEKYQGVNALFTLPFPKEKADEKKAEEILKKWLAETAQKESNETGDEELDNFQKKFRRMDAGQIQEEFTLIESAVQTVEIDESGNICYSWKAMGIGSGCDEYNVNYLLEGKDGVVVRHGAGANDKYFFTDLLKINKKNRTVTVLPYYKKYSRK